MRYVLATAVCGVLLLAGCGRSGGGKHTGAARTAEEKAVLAYLQKQYGETAKVASWGPHDMDGRLAAEVEVRRRRGWTEFPPGIMGRLKPGDKVLRAHHMHIKGSPVYNHTLYVFRGEQIICTDDQLVTGLEVHNPERWLESDLQRLRDRD